MTSLSVMEGSREISRDERLDCLIAEVLTEVVEEEGEVVELGVRRQPDISPWSSLPCHPALAPDWNEGEFGFVDWLTDCPCSGMGFAA